MSWRHLFRRPRGDIGCPKCAGEEGKAFWAANGIARQFPQFTESLLAHKAALKSGHLCTCARCGQRWYLDAHGRELSMVDAERSDLLEQWNKAVLRPSNDVLATLREIGGIKLDGAWGGRSGEILVPCQAETQTGEVVEFAVVRLSVGPPLGPHLPSGRSVAELLRAHPSVYALPASVRWACADAEEIRMGFAPVLIEGPGGKTFVLHGITSFLAIDGFQGSDFRTSRQPVGLSNLPPLAGDPETMVWFVGDRMPDDEELVATAERGRNSRDRT